MAYFACLIRCEPWCQNTELLERRTATLGQAEQKFWRKETTFEELEAGFDLYSLFPSSFRTTKSTTSKWKRGLSGFVNGRQISALADTGSLRNVVSQSFAQEMGLEIKPSPSKFMVGNSKIINSIGELVNPLTYPML